MSRDRDSKRIVSSRGGVVDINELLKDRRKLISVGPEESDTDSDSDWDDEEGAVSTWRWWWSWWSWSCG